MKKLLNLTMLLAALTLSFTACKKTVDEPKKPKGEKVDLLSAYYYASYSSMDMIFITEGAVKDNKFQIDNFVQYSISIKVASPGAKLANGTYTEKDLDMDYSFLVLGKEDYNNMKATIIKSAEIVVTDNQITAKFTTTDGFDFQMQYSGSITFADGDKAIADAPYEDEPKDKTAINLTLTDITATYGDSEGSRMLNLYIKNATDYAYIAVFVAAGSDNYNGTYNFEETMAVGTAMASLGYLSDFELFIPSYIAKVEGENLTTPFYFLRSGTVKIADSGITVNATSYFGSTVNITYSGSFTAIPQE